ncbi:MAG: cupredoxin domain-containing protein [Candidatus Magasanikbacteria bacterium]|nr:cupredoxin domain-containing protein [Candidatus Magasanikbacteria bacterium]
MKPIGLVLILLIIGIFVLWIWATKRKRGVAPIKTNGVQIFNILVKGVYAPNVIRAKFGLPIQINFKREEDTDCSRYVNFPDWHIRKELPQGQTVTIKIPADRKGTFSFMCDMSMYQGKLIIE